MDFRGAAVATPVYCLIKYIHKEIIHEHSVTEPAFEKYLFILLDFIFKNNKQPRNTYRSLRTEGR